MASFSNGLQAYSNFCVELFGHQVKSDYLMFSAMRSTTSDY